MKWEINEVSTPERIFKKISEDMAQPVGIILVGIDHELKDEVFRRCVEQIPNLATGYGGESSSINLGNVSKPFAEGRSVLAMLTEHGSHDHEIRHKVVEIFRDAGAATVVGIYAKCDERELRNVPTTDGLDYLIVIE